MEKKYITKKSFDRILEFECKMNNTKEVLKLLKSDKQIDVLANNEIVFTYAMNNRNEEIYYALLEKVKVGSA